MGLKRFTGRSPVATEHMFHTNGSRAVPARPGAREFPPEKPALCNHRQSMAGDLFCARRIFMILGAVSRGAYKDDFPFQNHDK
jgi:hypothetical protein